MPTNKPLLVIAISALLVLLVLLVLIAAGCGSSDSSSSTSTETVTEREGEAGSATSTEASGNASAPSGDAVRSEKVEIAEYAYSPDPIKIEEGGKVTWRNEDSVAHTATAEDGSFDTGTIDPGKLKSETFKQPGTYRYVCSIHPTMHGTIEVVPAG
jgi:plastocyanin